MIASYLRIDDQIPIEEFKRLSNRIPKHLTEKNARFRFYKDKQRNLFGLLLLNRLWQQSFKEGLKLENIRNTEFNRPYLPNSNADFNISHSGAYVICVLSNKFRVGIDIESNKEVELKDFKRTMNSSQWAEIYQSQKPRDLFFKYWCMKESVIKADGRGLSIPLTEIIFDSTRVSYGGNLWHLTPFQLDDRHPGCLSSNVEISHFECSEVHWSEFLK